MILHIKKTLLFIFGLCSSLMASEDVIRIACLGDSITYGARVNHKTESYPARLQGILGEGYKVENFGLGSATLIKAGRPNIWRKLEEVKVFKPHVVVILAGANDVMRYWGELDHFEEDYSSLIEALQNLPSTTRIVICTTLQLSLNTEGIGEKRLEIFRPLVPRFKEMRNRILKFGNVKQSKKIRLLDLYPSLLDKPDLFYKADGIHPNKKGYLVIAKLVAVHARPDDS